MPGVIELSASKKLADLPKSATGPGASMPAAAAPKTRVRSGEVNAHLYAARDARRGKKWADAIKSYEEAIKLAPEDSKLLDNTAWFLLTLEDDASRKPKRAVELATTAVELSDEKSGQYLGTLAQALYQTGDLEGAAARAEAAAKLDPHPERVERAERWRKELDEKLNKKLAEERRAAEAAKKAKAVATRRKSSIPEWPPRGAKADKADKAKKDLPVATSVANEHETPNAPETIDTGTGTPPWMIVSTVFAGLVCAAGLTLAFRRGRRASR